ncbi:alpha-L-arabinofuranosidase E [Geopyxis carbonaria]|nr:alpha-L-arabinofuranosidase E [Geopyxis carbonaria]
MRLPTLLTQLLCAAHAAALTLTVTPSASAGNASSPLLYGFMFEDINYSGDGGLHGQLLRNNNFQGTSGNTIATAWGSVNASIRVDASVPLSTALPASLRIDVAAGAAAPVGVTNAGYWGVPVAVDTYAFYFWVRGAYAGPATVALVGAAGAGTVYAAKTVQVASTAGAWSYVETTFACAAAAPDANNVLRLTFDGAALAGGGLNVGLPQLFPTTYKKRYNGLKPDIAGVLEDVGASFLRFPGGNNLEGSSPATRWKWNETVGPVHLRPGRQGDWGYPNTDALGLHEYFHWCTDMSLEPVLGVWAGLSLGGGIVTGAALQPYITDVLHELEYITGAASTPYGALRAANGRTEPWPLTYVEIGNEDQYNGGLDSYGARFTAFHAAISAAFPALTIIASTDRGLPSPPPAGTWVDIHHYATPDAFVALHTEFDTWPRSLPVLVGEYAVTRTNAGATAWWPSMQAACAEAVYMLGLERNSDVVRMAAYAPLLERLDHQQWVPDLVQFSSLPADLTRSTSYYVQLLFARNRGTHVLPVAADAARGPVYWVASVDAAGAAGGAGGAAGTYYVKLANYGAAAASVTVRLAGATAGTLTLLSAPAPTSNNQPGAPLATPVATSVQGLGAFTVALPAWAVAVLAVS